MIHDRREPIGGHPSGVNVYTPSVLQYILQGRRNRSKVGGGGPLYKVDVDILSHLSMIRNFSKEKK